MKCNTCNGNGSQNAPEVRSVDHRWRFGDYLGMIKVRAGYGRNNYLVKPGLYRIGSPGRDADVFVSANYKLSFDILRRELEGLDAWILVLDTKGVNVWCAAGKGTFGTEELINRIRETNLSGQVDHRKVIVPQLGAPGVSAHKVKDATGFKVRFGPVQASDINKYVHNGYQKSETERTISFNMVDRLILTPVEFTNYLKYLIVALALIILVSGFSSGSYSFAIISKNWISGMFIVLGSYISGTILSPLFLPWLPFRYFAGKGIIAGILSFGLLWFSGLIDGSGLYLIGSFMVYISISSYLAMQFTGSSTYTSLSGVKKELRLFIPAQIGIFAIGFVLFIISKFH